MDNLGIAKQITGRLENDTGKEVDFIQLTGHQFRFNGVADLYIGSFKVFDIVGNRWYRGHKKEDGYQILKLYLSMLSVKCLRRLKRAT